MFFSTPLFASEIKLFQLTDIEGSYEIRYFFDEQIDKTEIESTDGSKSVVVDNLLSSEIKEFGVNIQTHSFIYHPNFLTMDIGGGPVLVENMNRVFPTEDVLPGESSSEVGEGTATATLYNFNADLHLFSKKSYPISVFIDRSNPLIVPRYDEHFLQKNTKYGGKMALRNWALPVTVKLEAFRLSSQGKGSRIVVDNEVDEINLRFNQSLSFGGFRQLLIQSNRYRSNSGNIFKDSGTIEGDGTKVLTNSVNYNSRSVFGKKGQVSLTNSFAFVEQDLKPQLQKIKYSPYLRWDHSKTLNSFYQANYVNNTQDQVETIRQSAKIGYAKTNKNIGSHSGTLQAEQEISNGYRLDISTFSFIADYSYAISLLKFNVHLGFGYSLFEQVTENQVISKRAPSQRFILEPGSRERLKLDNAIASTIVVYEAELDSLKDKPLILGIHYTVEQSDDGAITTIVHRLDPDPNNRYSGKVIVDYDFLPGGTYSYQSTDQQYQIGIAVSKYLSIFSGISKAENDLVNGKPQFALQNINNSNYGLRFDLPLAEFLTFGGDSRIEQERTGITPNKRVSKNAYIRLSIFSSTFLQLSAQTTTVDYIDNEVLHDVDLVRYNLRIRTRPSRRTLMSLSAIGERDLANPIPRETLNILFKWKWNYRKLFFSLDAKAKLETQGATNYEDGVQRQERKLLRVSLERRF